MARSAHWPAAAMLGPRRYIFEKPEGHDWEPQSLASYATGLGLILPTRKIKKDSNVTTTLFRAINKVGHDGD